jgi:hypothetical protein
MSARTALIPGGRLLGVFADLFASAFAGQSLLHPFFLAGFQIKGVTLYVLNNVFGLNFTLKPAKSVL